MEGWCSATRDNLSFLTTSSFPRKPGRCPYDVCRCGGGWLAGLHDESRDSNRGRLSRVEAHDAGKAIMICRYSSEPARRPPTTAPLCLPSPTMPMTDNIESNTTSDCDTLPALELRGLLHLLVASVLLCTHCWCAWLMPRYLNMDALQAWSAHSRVGGGWLGQMPNISRLDQNTEHNNTCFAHSDNRCSAVLIAGAFRVR